MLPIRKFFNGMMSKFSPCPATLEYLKGIIQQKSSRKYRSYDEVWNGIYLGDAKGAKNLVELEKMGVTHILNAAHGSGSFLFVDTDEKFYQERNFKCTFKGIPAMDILGFDMTVHFNEAVEFIDSALKANGKIYVHCYQGVSRSATLVIVYLMMKQNMPAAEAVKWVRSCREIYPNDGFLEQICELDSRLAASRK